MKKMPPGVITLADRIHTRAAVFRVLLALCPALVLVVVPLGSGSWLALGSVPSSIEVDGRILIDNFEDVSDWSGLDLEMDITHNGAASGRWDDHLDQSGIRKEFDTPIDASAMNHIQLWLFSGVANGAQIEFIFDSDNEADPAGWDYFDHRLTIDWTGWRYIRVPLSDFRIARRPIGWRELNDVRFSAGGWGHEPLTDTLLILDDLSFGAGVLDRVAPSMGYVGREGDFVYTYTLHLAQRTGKAQDLTINLQDEPGSPFVPRAITPRIALPAGGSAQAIVEILVPADAIRRGTQLNSYPVTVLIAEGGEVIDGTTLDAAVPLPARRRPRLLLDGDDFTRIEDWSNRQDWAASARSGVRQAADAWPTRFEEKYHLSSWSLPPEGGQWGLWYICPDHGVRLRYEGPGQHVCPVDGKVYSGWPYEQVVYGWMHGDLARAARDNGLAYHLTGGERYAEQAAEILLRYADAYLTYPLHNVQGDPGGSAARVLSQTLDESIWLVPIAWAYDLIAESPALTPDERARVETDLLRPAAALIARNPAGMSNWQSWHNAGIASVGFALEDPTLIARAVRDPTNGFFYQMAESVTADGFWYEGSWGYHFFALQAHVYLAEMAARAGLDLYADPALYSMFDGPLRFGLPDGTLPPFNDSGTVDLVGRDGLYEAAYRRYGEAVLTSILGQRSRRTDALFWGVESLPDSTELDLRSSLFPDAGYAVLRGNQGGKPLYLALDYGPHGGGHGHYDKLGFVLYARDEMMAIDPGTQSYAAPTHKTWDKETVAHNTVVVDAETQVAATGSLHRFAALPSLGMVAANAGEACPDADLLRTMLVGEDYVIDRFRVRTRDGEPHALDWVYHNIGELTTDLPLTDYAELPAGSGYQHVTDESATTTDDDWQARFDLQPPTGQDYGGAWANEKGIGAAFTHSQEEVASGQGSGKLAYDFSATTGYIVFSTEKPDETDEAPDTLHLAIRGDNSGHDLTLRIYDSTDERFVHRIGPIDWTGWRVITATNVISWSHYLGNDDGVFDPPVGSVAVQLNHNEGGPPSGALFVDDITLAYPAAGETVVEDFEYEPRGVRLWMLGQTDTTVVTANGLGPDLLRPVPMVMARRNGDETTFTTLLEPIGAAPAVTTFAALETDAPAEDEPAAIAVTGDGFADRLLAVADGAPGTRRAFGDAACDGVLCLVRRDSDGMVLRLVLVEGTSLADGGTPLVTSDAPLAGLQLDYASDGTRLEIATNAPLSAPLRIFGPEVQSVVVDGEGTAFGREGRYVVLSAQPRIYLPFALHKDSKTRVFVTADGRAPVVERPVNQQRARLEGCTEGTPCLGGTTIADTK